MRRARLGWIALLGTASLVLSLLVATAAGGGSETFVLAPGLSAAQQHTAKTDFDGNGVDVTISGTVAATYPGSSSKCVWDAFYYDGCAGSWSPNQLGGVSFGVVGDPASGPFVPPFGKLPAFRADHTYTFTSTLYEHHLWFWAVPFGKPDTARNAKYAGGFTVTLGGAGWPAMPDALVKLESVSNGCGGGVAGAYGAQQKFGNTSTYLNSNNPLGTRYTVNFKPACDLHDAGYSGAKVYDPINKKTTDYFTYTQALVDTDFLFNMRALCEAQIPATAPVAIGDCKSHGGKTSLGAATRYDFVRSQGHHFYRARPDLNGVWSGDGVKVTIKQNLRSIRGSWQDGKVEGEFRGTLISRDQDSLVDGFVHTSAAPTFSGIKITVNPDEPNKLEVAGSVLSGTFTRG